MSGGVPIDLGLRSDSRVAAAGKHHFRIFLGKSATYMQPRSLIGILCPIKSLISCQNLLRKLLGPLPGGERSDRACAIRVRGTGSNDGYGPPHPEWARRAPIPTSPLWGEVKSGCVNVRVPQF
jgi:hypothetical protein